MEENKVKIGSTLKHIRMARELSLKDISERSGLDVSYISLLERGKRVGTLTSLIKLIETLEIPLSVFFFMAEGTTPLANYDPELAEKMALAVLRFTR